MNTSTIEVKRGPAKRLGLVALALAVACAGALSLSAGQAKADGGIQVEFDKGALNLGAAFKDKEILPSPARTAYWWDAFDSAVAQAAGEAFKVGTTPAAGAGVDTDFYLDQINLCTEKYGTTGGVTSGDPNNDMWPCKISPPGATVGSTGSALNILPVLQGSGGPAPSDGVIPVRDWPGAYLGDTATCQTTLGGISAALAALCWDSVAIPFSGSTYNPLTGAVEFQANAVRFPAMILPSPIDGSPVPVTIAVSGAPVLPTARSTTAPVVTPTEAATANAAKANIKVTGTFDRESGAMTLSGPLEARVLVAAGRTEERGGPTPFIYCAVPLPSISLSTTGGSTSEGSFPGLPYYYPQLDSDTESWFPGGGALAGAFNVTADSELVIRDDLNAGDSEGYNCNNVNNVVKGAGALWLGSGDVEAPVCGDDEVGNYPDCKAAKTAFAKPTIKVKKSVKAGKKIRATIRVKNNGTVEGTANVRVQTSNSRAKAPKVAVKVAADPNATGRKTVTLRTKKGKKGKVTIYATVGGKTGKATVRIK